MTSSGEMLIFAFSSYSMILIADMYINILLNWRYCSTIVLKKLQSKREKDAEQAVKAAAVG
jgi:hypothetical protein